MPRDEIEIGDGDSPFPPNHPEPRKRFRRVRIDAPHPGAIRCRVEESFDLENWSAVNEGGDHTWFPRVSLG